MNWSQWLEIRENNEDLNKLQRKLKKTNKEAGRQSGMPGFENTNTKRKDILKQIEIKNGEHLKLLNATLPVMIDKTPTLSLREVQQKIFEKYFTTKSGQNGSGLGLSIVKNVLVMHNATISLNSTSVSTTFTIFFNE